ncbi:hypothetical protein ATE92_0725 [Ulvibacter sp. MAR_2010_11]|uniref:hypothetical protein n=1 Tax=Ulvibacter sp. MAR_2010_11 TaxID=1250229 RepID=UPI000C2C0F8C|nr:hypothetical protein [Ulvibacter sp. MAR_2010_11]PKA82592.1 hypothetical protein ATE92_0725 [Ulvibacter sp. MAR_2010_11]
MKNSVTLLFLLGLVTSCQFFETEKISTETFYEEELKTINWKDVDQYPVFAACEHQTEKAAQKVCFETTLSTQIYEYISTKNIVATRDVNDTVLLDLSVAKDAQLSVREIKIDSLITQEFPHLKNWMLQCIDSIQLVAPAYKRGIPVKTEFTLPIVIKTKDL